MWYGQGRLQLLVDGCSEQLGMLLILKINS